MYGLMKDHGDGEYYRSNSFNTTYSPLTQNEQPPTNDANLIKNMASDFDMPNLLPAADEQKLVEIS